MGKHFILFPSAGLRLAPVIWPRREQTCSKLDIMDNFFCLNSYFMVFSSQDPINLHVKRNNHQTSESNVRIHFILVSLTRILWTALVEMKYLMVMLSPKSWQGVVIWKRGCICWYKKKRSDFKNAAISTIFLIIQPNMKIIKIQIHWAMLLLAWTCVVEKIEKYSQYDRILCLILGPHYSGVDFHFVSLICG